MVQKERAEFLRRNIADYRRRLARGARSETARVYLAEIAKAEGELAEIEKDDKRDKRE
jgi:uncharacterized tellurite resistance protein B-like protein